MTTRDPLHAAALGPEALETTTPIRSRRTLNDLRELAHYSTVHQHLDAAPPPAPNRHPGAQAGGS